jgi:hypothetical protein
VWLATPGSNRLSRDSGRIVALPGIRAFGNRRVDATGHFMDYDGRPQPGPGITTRGMLIGGRPDAKARYYLKVYPALAAEQLGPAGSS